MIERKKDREMKKKDIKLLCGIRQGFEKTSKNSRQGCGIRVRSRVRVRVRVRARDRDKTGVKLGLGLELG